jgi:hypothetical protein
MKSALEFLLYSGEKSLVDAKKKCDLNPKYFVIWLIDVNFILWTKKLCII